MDWEPADIPILEHAKYFTQCKWLLVVKNEAFFREAREVIV